MPERIMKRLKVLKRVLIQTRADKIIYGFVAFFLVSSFVIFLREPEIKTYWDAIWYMYAVFSTAGFGDFVAVTVLGRILSIMLTLYTILVVAVVTGVVVAFYNDLVAVRYKASKAEIQDQLEHLEDLSKEELAEISRKIRELS